MSVAKISGWAITNRAWFAHIREAMRRNPRSFHVSYVCIPMELFLKLLRGFGCEHLHHRDVLQ